SSGGWQRLATTPTRRPAGAAGGKPSRSCVQSGLLRGDRLRHPARGSPLPDRTGKGCERMAPPTTSPTSLDYGVTRMSKSASFLPLALLSGAAVLLGAGPAEAQFRGVPPRGVHGPIYPPNRMPGWDWWRIYPWSPYNYGRNPYNPAWFPYGGY